MSVPQDDEWAAVAEQFGVDQQQVRRDHLISHVLGALAGGVSTDDLVFIGGTALSRTHLADARLSEHIDLVAFAPRAQVAAARSQRSGEAWLEATAGPPGARPLAPPAARNPRSSPSTTRSASRSSS